MKRCGLVLAVLFIAAAIAAPLAAPRPAGAALELKFYYPVGVSGPLARVMDGMVSDFNRIHPGIHVTPIFAGGYYDTMTKTQTAVMAGAPPDVAVLLSTDLFTLLDLNAVIPLDGFIQESGGDRFRSDFFDAFWLNSRTAATTYSIPFQRSTIILYYNQDAFQRAGLDPAKPPRTWAELLADAQQLTLHDSAGTVTQWGVGIPTSGFTYWLFQGFAAEAGQARIASPDGTETYFDTPQTHRALQYWLQLADRRVEPRGIVSWDTLPTEFVAGRYAMIYHSTGSLTFIRSNAPFKFGTAFMPADRRFGTPTGGGNLYIFRGIPPERQRAAWEFVQWMTAPQQAARWSEASGYVAVRKSAFNIKLYKEYTDKFPQALTARDQLPYAQAELSTHHGGEIQNLFSNDLQAALTGRKTPGAALRDAQQQADRLLGQYRKK
jgi:sn-glycerol 3-phosphate transport system substrate-binding protein